jgi:hypothetical protein
VNLWDEEVLKERAKIYAQRNPNPPLSGGAVVVVVILAAAATVVACMAWKVVL